MSSAMGKGRKHEEWMQDVATRQRNVVFPDTVQNEARFWRNLGNPPFTTIAKVGLGLLALFVFGTAGSILGMLIRNDRAWRQEVVSIVVVTLLIFGPIFGAIIWATRRNLQKLRRTSQARKRP